MRSACCMTIEKAIADFLARPIPEERHARRGNNGSVWHDGITLYSYSTIIAQRRVVRGQDIVLVNNLRYSPTTDRIQRELGHNIRINSVSAIVFPCELYQSALEKWYANTLLVLQTSLAKATVVTRGRRHADILAHYQSTCSLMATINDALGWDMVLPDLPDTSAQTLEALRAQIKEQQRVMRLRREAEAARHAARFEEAAQFIQPTNGI
jgi:hypothetical protein